MATLLSFLRSSFQGSTSRSRALSLNKYLLIYNLREKRREKATSGQKLPRCVAKTAPVYFLGGFQFKVTSGFFRAPYKWAVSAPKAGQALAILVIVGKGDDMFSTCGSRGGRAYPRRRVLEHAGLIRR